jgi:hypothetical protein
VAGPSLLAGLLAAVMLATAAYCASRLMAAWRWRRPTEYDADGAHLLMGVAMAGMLVPRLDPLPVRGWEMIFGLAAAWFGWRTARGYLGQRARRFLGLPHPARRVPAGHHPARHHAARHHLHHLLACGAMLYMLLAVSARATGMPAMPEMSGGPAGAAATPPPLTLGLALVLFVGVLWAADRLHSPAPALAAGPPPAAVPAVVAGPQSATVLAWDQAAGPAGNPAAGPDVSPAALAPAAPIPPALPDESPAPPPSRTAMSPRLAACCEIVMGLTMGYMLITML